MVFLISRAYALLFWLIFSTTTFHTYAFSTECLNSNCQITYVNYRPLLYPQSTNWTAELAQGTGRVSLESKNSFGLLFKIESSDLASVKLQFLEENSFRKSYIYNLAEKAPSDQLWLYQQSGRIFDQAPQWETNSTDANAIRIFYQDLGPGSWQSHVWDPFGVQWTRWDQGVRLGASKLNGFQHYVELPLPPFESYIENLPQYTDYPEPLGLIVHKGEEKASPKDLQLFPSSQGSLYFLRKGDPQLYCSPDFSPCPSAFKTIRTAAHWVGKDHLVWDTLRRDSYRYELVFSYDGTIQSTADLGNLSQDQRLRMWPDSIPQEYLNRFPHLGPLQGFRIEGFEGNSLEDLLKSQLLVLAIDPNTNTIVDYSRLQLPGVIDESMAYDGILGLDLEEEQPTLKLWAPTAQSVTLKVYEKNRKTLLTSLPMEQLEKGVWRSLVEPRWLEEELYYRFELKVFHYVSGRLETYEVTDPYSVSLSMNSSHSQFVDLSSNELKPSGWDQMQKPVIDPADISIMEVHVRDFSISDTTVKEPLRGKYLAFSQEAAREEKQPSNGYTYLSSLSKSGLTHVQLLPVNDFGTVNENQKEQLNLNDSLTELCKRKPLPYELCERFGDKSIQDVYKSLATDTAEIAAINEALAGFDAFNWGYDPVHYGVPEGSYATNPEGSSRILEFRTMVYDLWKMGLRTSIDVVYNHTMDALLWNFSILDKTVPGYYFRRNPTTGFIESSTCCNNTATEHKMMEHLMIATLKRWQDEYKVDAFRFDLMGHHMKYNMLNVKQALNPGTFLYGEGWNFGEVKDNSRGINASQKNMAGTGIGTFNDRFRDAVRGGAPFDCGVLLHQQGLLQGLYFDNNELGSRLNPTSSESNCQYRDNYALASPGEHRGAHQETEDRLRIGLIGSIKRFNLFTHYGQSVDAEHLGPWGYPIGYVDQPFESINYVSKHDNQTLWDFNQLKLPLYMDMRERAKTQWLALSLNTLAQGVPFFHFGVDLLRSKSQIRDSYNAGDWFNGVDLSRQTNRWNVGLPLSNPSDMNWNALQTIARSIPNSPEPAILSESYDYFRKLLKIRYGSKLFRLNSAQEIRTKVSFLNNGPRADDRIGLIVMKINDAPCSYGGDLDPSINDYVVVFNTRPWPVKLEALGYQVHPELSNYAQFNGSSLQVDGRSTAVIYRPQDEHNCYTDQPVYITAT